jgi:hypothetical protein
MGPNDVTFTVPVQVTIRVGTASGGPAFSPPPPPAGTAIRAGDVSQAGAVRRLGRKEVEGAVAVGRKQLAARSDVVSIEPGYRFRDGWITNERCVVIGVRRKVDHQELAAAGMIPLPSQILGVPTDVRVAAVADPANQLLLEALRAAKGQPVSNYKPRPDLPLNLVEDTMEVTLHASPDAGWPTLSDFLGRTENRLTVGMYEFTAPHIAAAVKDAISPAGRRFSLVLENRDDRRSGLTANDTTEAETVQELTDAVGKRLSFAWASVTGPNRLFDAAYHIKVAVRDGKEFWLSSGNWRSSNQPPYDPIKDGDQTPPLIQQGDRDWHAIVTHPGLAGLFEKHLLRDEEEAATLQEAVPQPAEPEVWVPEEYFRPTEEELEAPVAYRRPLSIKRRVKVQPLLTPDNYAAHVVPLIQSANKSLYFQNQSLKVYGDNGQIYEELLQALLQKQQDSRIEVKIIFRRFGDPRTDLTALKDYGFDTNTDKIRVLTNSHTKGIVVDGESVLIGSQNWTKDGTAYNRDASLILYDRDIASYFEQLFLYDWRRSGKSGITESLPAVEVVKPDEAAPRPGRVRMPWSAWFGR